MAIGATVARETKTGWTLTGLHWSLLLLHEVRSIVDDDALCLRLLPRDHVRLQVGSHRRRRLYVLNCFGHLVDVSQAK